MFLKKYFYIWRRKTDWVHMRKIAVIIALFLAAIQIVSAQKVGLVLSGGGAKGAAHIGVIKALEEK